MKTDITGWMDGDVHCLLLESLHVEKTENGMVIDVILLFFNLHSECPDKYE